MKFPWESIEIYLSRLTAEQGIVCIVLAILAWKSPAIIREFLTHARENPRVKSDIENKRKKTDLEIARKLEKKERRRGPIK